LSIGSSSTPGTAGVGVVLAFMIFSDGTKSASVSGMSQP
jgi:mannitol-specific phosphotransferase system IIBC component